MYSERAHDLGDQFAQKMLNALDQEGSLKATVALGKIFEKNNNIPQAIKHFEKAAEKENGDALFSLGYIYHEFEKDLEKAQQYYLKAAEIGNGDAYVGLGCIYRQKGREARNEQATKQATQYFDDAFQSIAKAAEIGFTKFGYVSASAFLEKAEEVFKNTDSQQLKKEGYKSKILDLLKKAEEAVDKSRKEISNLEPYYVSKIEEINKLRKNLNKLNKKRKLTLNLIPILQK